MSKRMHKGWMVLAALGLSACAQEETAGLGQLEVALSSSATSFVLSVHEGLPGEGKKVFDSKCLALRSQTYELKELPTGTGYSILFEGFADEGCTPSSRVDIGFRGGVSISEDAQPYFHVQTYAVGQVTALPEDINLSSAFSTVVETCSASEGCEANQQCHTEGATSWCVPTCQRSSECTDFHPRATCDEATQWCMLREPFPLNLSESRAFGAASTLANGDVVLVGGLRTQGGAASERGTKLSATTYKFERFNAASGLFEAYEIEGLGEHPGGAFGSTELAAGVLVLAGGTQVAELKVNDGDLAWSVSSGGSVSGSVRIYDFNQDKVASARLAKGVLMPSVLALSTTQFLVVGGLSYSGDALEASKAVSSCQLKDDFTLSCQSLGELQAARVAPALGCVDATCKSVVVLGGSESMLAELLTLGDDFSAEALTSPKQADLKGARLCGDVLVGGAGEAFDAPHRYILDEGVITWAALDGHLAAWSAYVANDCALAGGLQAGTVSSAVTLLDDNGLTMLSATLNQPRFGALAATVGAGPLKGMTLFAGGLNVKAQGVLESVRGAEMLTR